MKRALFWLESHYIISSLIAILIAAFIFYLSSIPASGFPSGLGIKTKIYHFGIFFLLSFFLCISIVRGKHNDKYLIFLALLLSIAYSVSDETHQLFVVGRHSDIIDVIIDSIGIVLAGIFYSLRRILRNIKPFSK